MEVNAVEIVMNQEEGDVVVENNNNQVEETKECEGRSEVEVKKEAKVKNQRKLIWLTGDPNLFPPKAQKLLGLNEMEPEMIRQVYRSVQAEREQAEKRLRQKVENVSRMQPTPEQMALPNPNQRVSEKALRILGDERLERASRLVVTKDELNTAKNHPKVFQILGEPALVSSSSKILKRFGSDMNPDQRRAQMKENAREEKKREENLRQQLITLLRAPPSDDQLSLPRHAQNQQISEKALRFFGDERLEELSRRAVTPEMRKNVNAKTLRLLGDVSLLSEKQRQLLGTLDAPVQRQRSWRNSVSNALGGVWQRKRL